MKRRIISSILTLSMVLSMLPVTVWASEADPDTGLCPHHTEHTEECGYIPASEGAPCAHVHTEDCWIEVVNCVHVHDESCYSVGEDEEPAAPEVSVEDEGPADSAESGNPDASGGEDFVDEAETEDPDIVKSEESEDGDETVFSLALEARAAVPEADVCTHVCTEESGCVTRTLVCAHEHDEACGYAGPVDGAPCTYFCEICAGLTDEPEVSEDAEEPDAADAAVEEAQALIDVLPTVREVRAMDEDSQRTAYGQTQTAYDAYMALSDEQRGLITGAGVFDELFAFFNGQTAPLAGEITEINSFSDFQQFRDSVNEGNTYSGKTVTLKTNITLSGAWTPIGNSSIGFDGTFDGGSHTVFGLYINSTSKYQGLFGRITSNGVIKNLGVDGSVTGDEYIGGIVGYNSRGSVINCTHDSGTVTGEEYVGGVVGYNNAGTITDCVNSGTVTGNEYSGGIVGYNESGSISDCTNSGTVKTSGNRKDNMGGIVGNIRGSGNSVTGCSNSGDVMGQTTETRQTEAVGGIVGYGSNGFIAMCYNTGTITSNGWHVGGILGDSSGSKVELCYNTGDVTSSTGVGGIVGYEIDRGRAANCYNTGTITATNNSGSAGGIFGGVDDYFTTQTGSITCCYNIGTVVGSTIQAIANYDKTYVKNCYYLEIGIAFRDTSNTGVTGINTTQLATQGTFENWNFSSIWMMGNSAGRPILRDNPETVRAEYGGEGGTITTTYGTTVTKDLDDYMGYSNSSVSAKGNFTYTITGGNTIGATITGTSTLNIPSTANANESGYTLTIVAKEKEPQYATLAMNYGTSDVTLTVKVIINKANPTVTAPTAKSLIFNNSPQALVNAGSTIGGTLQYSTDQNGTYNTTIPTGTNAGDYTVWYKVMGETNYNNTQPQSVTVTISPRSISEATITLDQESFTYNGTPQTATVTSVTVDGLNVIGYGITGNSNTNVGEYYLTITGSSNFTGSATKKWTINKTAPIKDMFTYTPPTDLTYDGNAKTATVALKNPYTGAGNITVKYGDSTTAPKDAGTYTVTIDVAGGSNFNSASGIQMGSFTIQPKNISGATITLAKDTFTYNGTQQTVTVNSVIVDGLTATYNTTDGDGGTNAGNYTLTITGTNNFTGTATAGWKISQKQLTPQVASVESKTYDGKTSTTGTISLTGAVSDQNPTATGTFHFVDKKVGENKVVNVTGITLTGSWGNNYVLSTATLDTTATISPRVAELKWVEKTDFVYNGTSHSVEAELTNIVNGDTVTLTYKDNEKTANGTYTAVVIGFGGTDGGNYTVEGAENTTLEWTIGAQSIRNAVVTVSGVDSYNGTVQNPTVVVMLNGATLNEEADYTYTVSYEDGSETEVKNAGRYTITVTGQGGYVDTATDSFTVEKAVLTPSGASAESKTYDGNTNTTGTISLTGAALGEAPTASGTFNFGDKVVGNNKAVTVTNIKLDPKWEANYTLSPTDSLSATANITALQAVLTWNYTAPFTYQTGTTRTVTAELKNKVTGDDVTLTYEGNEQSEVGSYTAKVTLTGTDSGNYTMDGVTNAELVWKINEASQPTPNVSIDYVAESLTGTSASMQYRTDGSNWQSCSANMPLESIGWNGAAMTVYLRYPAKTNYAESQTQTLEIPARPDAPANAIRITKSTSSIALNNVNSFVDCQYALAESSGAALNTLDWKENGTFTGLNAGSEYILYVRFLAVNGTGSVSRALTRAVAGEGHFASIAAYKVTVTANADGSTTLQPGETVETEDGGTITNNGENVTLEDSDGTTTTVTPPGGKDFNSGVEVDGDGNVAVPGGSTVTPPRGPDITVGPGNGGTMDKDGNITLPGGGNAKIGDTTVTVPEDGGTLTPNGDGTVNAPPGSKITDKDGKESTVPSQGGKLDGEGNYTASSSGGSGGGGSGGGGSSGGDSSSVTAYPPTISKVEHGKSSVSPSNPKYGDTVTITPTPDEGYEVGDVVVKDRNGNKLEVKDNGDGTFTFTQPTGKVTVEVSFVLIACDGGPDCPGYSFADLNAHAWYHEAVDYVIRNSLMNGYGNGMFGPNDTLSRAMLAQILYNQAGSVPVNYLMQYNDVSANTWYIEAVRWAASEGIISGYGNGQFGPDDPITREQLVAMLYRYEQFKFGVAETWIPQLTYTDVAEISDWAYDAMGWGTMNGIIEGKGNNILDPKGKATRAEAASMLMRFLSRMVRK